MKPSQVHQQTSEKIDTHVDKFDRRTLAAQRQMWGKVFDLIKSLETDELGNIKPNTENLKKLRTIQPDLKKAVSTKGYKKGVKTLLGGFDEVKKVTDKHLSAEAQRE